MDELKIIKYLDGEMTVEESRAFEEEIRMNPSLAEELERYRQIQDLARELLAEGEEGLELDEGEEGAELDEGAEESNGTEVSKGPEDEVRGVDPAVEKDISEAVHDYKSKPESFDKVSPEFRRELEDAEKEFMNSRISGYPNGEGRSGEVRDSGSEDEGRSVTESSMMIRRIWYRAAAIVILMILSILVFRPFSKMTSDEVYAKYFHPFHKTDQVLEMARNDNDFLFAVEVYEAGDFERAVVLFEMLADSSVFRAWSLFYAGNSYLSLMQSNQAISSFQKVLTEGEEEIYSHARWQLALGYLSIGKKELAREQLDILSKDPVYRKDSKRIIRIIY